MTEPYVASEDSAFLRRQLNGLKGRRALEIGAGNGGNLIELAWGFELVVGTDLTRPSTIDWKAGADFVLTDLATCFRNEVFDLVVFNPPYLPSEEVDDRAVDAGKEDSVPLSFLREAFRVVSGSGKILFLVAGESSVKHFEKECARKGFRMRMLGREHLFYEELCVYEARGAG